MAVLVDTGVLLRAFNREAPERAAILQALHAVRARGDGFIVAVQNVAEFWNVATRPKDKNGFALPAEVVERRLRVVERFAQIVTESPASYAHWKRLVTRWSVQGVKVHDARLVSVMLAEGIQSVLTLNDKDFERYQSEGIKVETPASVLAS